MTKIEIPKSVFEYFNNSIIETAVNHILGLKKGALPSNVEWSDLKEFYRASLFAHQTQCEHAAILVDLWTAIWKPTFEHHSSQFLPYEWAIEPTQIQTEHMFDPKSLWEIAWFGKCFSIFSETKILTLGVSMSPEYGIQLSIDFADSNGNPIDLELPEVWPREELEDNTAWTKARLIEIQAEELDISELVSAATGALNVVKSYRS